MKLDIFLIIGLIVNTIFAVLYPAQIFGDDPLGLSGVQDTELSNYTSVNGAFYYNPTTNQLEQSKDLTTDIKEAIQVTDGDNGLLPSGLLTFIDWVKFGFALIKTMLMFVLGFIMLLWNLTYPFNLLIGLPFSLLYIYGIVSFVMGRS